MTVGGIIKRESRISAAINMTLSAAFFMFVFGAAPRPLTLEAPDMLALDFLPQSLAIGFFSALVPALLFNGKRRKGLIGGLDSKAASAKGTLLRAIAFAAGAGALGALIAITLPMAVTQIDYFPALALKISYGGLLAILITPRAIRASLQGTLA